MASSKINGRQLASSSVPASALTTSLPQHLLICDLTGTPTFSTLAGDAFITSNPTNNSFDLVLTPSGVTAGFYGSATKSNTFTVDGKGRLTEITSVLITPDFSSIVNLPTTLAGYGITDSLEKLEAECLLVSMALAIIELQLFEVNKLILLEEQSKMESPLLSIAANVILNQVMFIQQFTLT